VITLEDWALIRRLAAEGVPNAKIARRLGISRTTVVKAVGSAEPPQYRRTAVETSFVSFEDRVRALLAQTPDMPATVLAERVGWSGSITWFRANVKRIRVDYLRVDPSDRLVWLPGDAVQCDLWFPPRKIVLEDGTARLLPVLVMALAFSRFTLAVMIPTRKTDDLLLGMWRLLGTLGRVPQRFIWDNEAGIGRGDRRPRPVTGFMGMLGSRLVLLPPRDPESKGVVERRNGWFETSFMPGREFTSPADFNTQFTDWLGLANQRMVRTLKDRPADLLVGDRAAMRDLPPVPLHLGWRNRIRLGRDYYVRVDSNDYSVDPWVIGRLVDVHADLDRVRVRCAGQLVADHARVWARGTTITDSRHVTAAKALRRAFQQPRPPEHPDAGLVRDLADYDRAFGLDGQVS
jgi:transposase